MTVSFTAGTSFLVATLASGQSVPQSRTLTTTASAAAGATSLAVTATTGYINAGRKLTVGTVEVTVTADTPVGSTALPIKALTTGQSIASAATGTYYELFEFIGGSEASVAAQESTISIRNFKSGKWASNAKTMTGLTVTCSGQLHVEDYALKNVLRPAAFELGQEVYADLTRPDGDRYRGAFLVNGYQESAALDNVVTVSFTLNSNGAVTLPAPLAPQS